MDQHEIDALTTSIVIPLSLELSMDFHGVERLTHEKQSNWVPRKIALFLNSSHFYLCFLCTEVLILTVRIVYACMTMEKEWGGKTVSAWVDLNNSCWENKWYHQICTSLRHQLLNSMLWWGAVIPSSSTAGSSGEWNHVAIMPLVLTSTDRIDVPGTGAECYLKAWNLSRKDGQQGYFCNYCDAQRSLSSHHFKSDSAFVPGLVLVQEA